MGAPFDDPDDRFVLLYVLGEIVEVPEIESDGAFEDRESKEDIDEDLKEEEEEDDDIDDDAY